MIGLWECYEIEDSDEWCEFCREERPCECDEDDDYEHWDIADIDQI